MYDLTITTVPAMTVTAVPHRGSYLNIGHAFELLFGTLTARGLMPTSSRMVGLFYDDARSVAPEKLRSEAGVITPTPIAAEPPLERIEIPESHYATVQHKGPYADLQSVYNWLLGEWLPNSGETQRTDIPAWEEYLNTPMDTPPEKLLTNVYLPLR